MSSTLLAPAPCPHSHSHYYYDCVNVFTTGRGNVDKPPHLQSSADCLPRPIALTNFLTFTTTPGPIHISRGGSRCTCPFPHGLLDPLDNAV